MMKLLKRLLFSLRYRTFGNKAACGNKVLVCHRGRTVELPRRCPHQGAPLETGYIQGDHLLCPWHGCKFKLDADATR